MSNELRKQIIGSLSTVQLYEPNEGGELAIEVEADKLEALIAAKKKKLLQDLLNHSQMLGEMYQEANAVGDADNVVVIPADFISAQLKELL